jgi:tetratricopeptide (TPR) repeat protein
MKRSTVTHIGLLLSLGLTSCTYNGLLKSDFYKPGPVAQPKIPMTVAVVVDPALKNQTVHYTQFANATFVLHPAVKDTVKAELGQIFESVSEVDDAAQATNVDAVAFIKPNLSNDFELTLKAPGSDVILGQYTDKTAYSVRESNGCMFWAFMTGFTLLLASPITIPAGVACDISSFRSSIEEALDGHLKKIGSLIREDSKLAQVRSQKTGTQSEEKQGDDSVAAGKHYAAALQNTSYDAAADQRLKEKMMRLLAALPALPAIPEEAHRHTVHGQTLLKMASDSGDYHEAVNAFEQAMREAPFWPDAYYNLGLVYANAKRYREAIRNLKLYLIGAPNSPDAHAVQNKIYELEVMPGAMPAPGILHSVPAK